MRGRRIFLAVLMGVLFLGAIAGVGITAYNAGMAQGVMAAGNAAIAPEGATVPMAPYYAPYWMHRPFGFGLLGCLVPLFFVLFLFAMFRFVFGPRRWRHGWGGPGMHMHGTWDPSQGDVPPTVQAWHRKLHEQDAAGSDAAPAATA